MPRLCANLGFLFGEVPFLDRFDAAARAGFKGVEFASPYEYPAAESEDTMKFDVWGDVFPPGPGAYPAIPRVLTSAFIDEWHGRHDDATQEAARLRDQIVEAMTRGALGEMLPFTGQTAGLIGEILPAAEITRRIVAEAEEVLRRTIKVLV